MNTPLSPSSSSSLPLDGKVALVTGASKGIGAAIAKALAAHGAKVVVNYASDKPGAERVVSEIVEQGGTALAFQASVTDGNAVGALVDEFVSRFGGIDIVVNNAGVYEFGALDAITPEHFHRLFDTNVLGLLQVTQAASRHLKEGASIINIGSGVTRITPPESAVYTATKGAVDAITGVLSKELGPRGIRVNSINPGMIETEGTHTAGFIGSDFEKTMVSQTPLGRLGQPGDIAGIAVFLASDASCWLTGETLLATGGLR